MKTTLMTVIVFGAVTASAWAQPTDSMKCADFTAMNAEAQMAAVRSMKGLMPMDDRMAAEHMTPSGPGPSEMGRGKMGPGRMMGSAMSADETFETVSHYCRDHPDMMVGDAMMEPKQR